MALWQRILATAPDGVLVADVAGHGVRGVARIGADPDDARHGPVFSLYVHPDAQGLGLGRTLLRDAGTWPRPTTGPADVRSDPEPPPSPSISVWPSPISAAIVKRRD